MRRSISVLLAAVCLVGAGAAPGMAMGPHDVVFTPSQPFAGQPFTLTTTAAEIAIGVGMYAWDLDGDGQCETPYSTDPSITVTLPAGRHYVSSCAYDSSSTGTWTCGTSIDVVTPVDKPGFTVTQEKKITVTEFLEKGIRLHLAFSPPTRARFTVRFAGEDLVVRKVRGDLYRINPPSRRLARASVAGRKLQVFPDITSDPRIGMMAESWNASLRSDLLPKFSRETSRGRAHLKPSRR